MNAARTTTLRTLLRLGAALVVLTLLTGWFTWSAFDRVHDNAVVAHERTVPAILEVTAARNALIAADRAAVRSFHTGEARLAGPGEEYRSQIATARQYLTQAAEDITSADDSQRLRVVQGLLASYTGSIEQAAAIYRQDRDAPLWQADLWNATQLLHEVGVLAELDTRAGDNPDEPERLGHAQRQALDGLLGSSEQTWRTVCWTGSATVLFAVLVMTQMYLRRRFRRRVNPGFLAALTFLLILVAVACLTFSTADRLANVQETVDNVTVGWKATAEDIDAERKRDLAQLMWARCAEQCGYRIDEFIEQNLDVPAPGDGPVSVQMADGTERIKTASAAAVERKNYEFLLPLGTVLVLVSFLAGLYFHIDQYRYRVK